MNSPGPALTASHAHFVCKLHRLPRFRNSCARKLSVWTPIHKSNSAHSRGCARVQVSATAEARRTEGDVEELQIEGLRSDYCDDFVCTSSPAVEQTVRSLARDLVRQSWTRSLFARDVSYRGGLRRCSGLDKHLRLTFIPDNVKDAKVLVRRLQMLDSGSAVITWRLRGGLAAFPVDVNLSSTFELDLITGRVRSHRDEWDLSRCSLPARLAWTASQVLWSAKEVARDVREGGSGAMKKLTDRGDGDEQRGIMVDPMDPTRFLQQDSNPNSDLFSLLTIAALLYLVASAYFELEKIR